MKLGLPGGCPPPPAGVPKPPGAAGLFTDTKEDIVSRLTRECKGAGQSQEGILWMEHEGGRPVLMAEL